MRLIIHIGTHKTGTTALQGFLHSNRDRLAGRGFYYAAAHGARDSNASANALNVAQNSVVRRFFRKQVEYAHRRAAHTILVSAENFYAMSVLDSMQRREVCTNALERDQALIQTLQSLLPDDIGVAQIVCYFRRPDQFAESLYGQHVKRDVSFEGTFAEFLPILEPALLYNAYMELWSGAFGSKNCIVRLYEAARGDIVNDFLVNVLGIYDVGQFTKARSQANERVGRDLLEFKRLINRNARFNERDIERAILRLVDEEMKLRDAEPAHYQDHLSPCGRAELLRRVRPEMEGVQASYDLPPFPAFDLESAKSSWRPYPGLGDERRSEIERRYNRINGRFGFRLERLALRSAGVLRRNVPGTGAVLDVLKKVGAKQALHGVVTGMQRGGG